MPDTIPLRRLTLYKHGVGYLTRQGTIAGSELALPFRSDEVDDALKSLVAITLDGGRITGIQYPTPENKAERFAQLPLSLRPEHSLFDLLRDLRGTAVSLQLHGGDVLRGRVIGIEEHPQGREFGASLALLDGTNTVTQVPTDRIARVELGDERMAADLGFYLDTARAEEARRVVTVRVDEPGRHVQVSYVVPSPIWRVSYRLVGERGEQALLQGWGIFDNRLEEDLEDVEVTLVAGQPISFRYDLTSSFIPPRRLIRDEGRVAAGPVEFEGAAPAMPAAVVSRSALPLARQRPREFRADMAEPGGATPEGAETSTLLTTQGQDLDELFEYRVGGVSVNRGESAMIPIVQHTAGYRRELLYNAGKLADHPVVSIRMKNETGLTLERGPVTVIEDGQYRGEAILPFTRTDGEIVLAYAVEIGIDVARNIEDSISLAGLALEGAYLQIQRHHKRTTTYTITNKTGWEQVVTIEQPIRPGAELVGTPPPDEETASERRWPVTCPPGKTTFRVGERVLLYHRESLLDQHLSMLAEYLQHRSLDDETRRRLQHLLDLRQAIEDADVKLAALKVERGQLAERQDRLRRNLEIKPESEQEREIRRHSAEEFRRSQDRESLIDAEIEQLKAERQRLKDAVQSEVGQLA